MNYPALPHYKKDRLPNTLYMYQGQVRLWTGTQLSYPNSPEITVPMTIQKIQIKKKVLEQKSQSNQKAQKSQVKQKAQPSQKIQTGQKAQPSEKPITAQFTITVPKLATKVQLVPQYSGKLMPNGWASLEIGLVEGNVAGQHVPLCKTFSNGLGAKYRAAQLIGQGAFGAVYLGANIETHERVAIKVESRQTTSPQLLDEATTLKKLTPYLGLPNLYWVGSNQRCHIMVIQYLGQSLESVFQARQRQFEESEIISIARQVLRILEHVHNSGYINRDIKPDNLVLGPPIYLNQQVYMVDFGVAYKYMDDKGKHIELKKNMKPTGTYRYMSLNVHEGIRATRRDDLESLGYCLIYFFKGRLPWQGLNKILTKQQQQDKIHELKKAPLEELCASLPPYMLTYMKTVRALGYKSKPNYSALISLFPTCSF